VFFIAVILGGVVAAEVAYLFGLPVLTLGSDYFGIATLGFTIIVKVLLDNSDTMFGFEEMKGARGMIGIPHQTTWAWVFIFLLIVGRHPQPAALQRWQAMIPSGTTRFAKAMGIDVAALQEPGLARSCRRAGRALQGPHQRPAPGTTSTHPLLRPDDHHRSGG
jgi:branched-chain amino acid transport system permease protein